MSLITSVAPSPFSVRTIIHGAQQAGFNEFTEYDFGITKNKQVYGRAKPPAYNLTNIVAPIAIMVNSYKHQQLTSFFLMICMTFILHFRYIGGP